jgi:hypothetical protein
MTMLPTERDLPAAAHAETRARLVATAAEPPPARTRRWVPLASAAAVVALVAGAAGAVALADRDRAPTTPGASPTTARKGVTGPIPPLAEVAGRCGVQSDYRFTTRYEGDGAVSWLFRKDPSKATVVCTWEDGQTGTMANFANDWFGDGMAPATDGQIHVTQDQMFPNFEDGATTPPEYAQWNRDRQVFLGPVPASVTKVVVAGPDGRETAALGSHWFLHHFSRKGSYTVTAYDAAGEVVGEPVKMSYGMDPVVPRPTK